MRQRFGTPLCLAAFRQEGSINPNTAVSFRVPRPTIAIRVLYSLLIAVLHWSGVIVVSHIRKETSPSGWSQPPRLGRFSTGSHR